MRHKPAGYASCFDYSVENPVPDGKSITKPFKFSKPRVCLGLPLTFVVFIGVSILLMRAGLS